MKKISTTKKIIISLCLFLTFTLFVAGCSLYYIGTDKIGQILYLHKKHATKELETHIREMRIKAKGYSCTNQDSDGDDYVSCTLELDVDQQCPQDMSLDCAKWSLSGLSGCKIKEKLEVIKR